MLCPSADRKQSEEEYQDAKARLAAVERAGVKWDQRAGIAPLRAQYERSRRAERRARMRMARTRPTTLPGAAAMIDHTLLPILEGKGSRWPLLTLKRVAAALTRMTDPRQGGLQPPAETSINPKLTALAALFDETRAEFARVLHVLEVADKTPGIIPKTRPRGVPSKRRSLRSLRHVNWTIK